MKPKVRIETEEGEFEFVKTVDEGCAQCDLFERCYMGGKGLLGCRAYLCELLADSTGIFKRVDRVATTKETIGKESGYEDDVHFGHPLRSQELSDV